MRKITLFVLIVLSHHLSCQEKFSTPELKKHFNEIQIEDLNKITDFFQMQICSGQDKNFNECFSELLPKLVEFGWQPILERVDFEKQKELYHEISESTFDEIWEFTKSTESKSNNEYKRIVPSFNGKYQKFLSDISDENSELDAYTKRLKSAGDFESMGLLQQDIYLKPEKFDLENPNIQILIAIHFLSQNDQQKRNDK